ncbi:MAG: hypothetical protein AUH85_14810 [Chloroflexi bacterium 13_1_40CM_4_68_4]|nr:MAG: hypothetical protein AUH85_14810 [Chloroflexi bacterium 13_1_40CM_4_68_4]
MSPRAAWRLESLGFTDVAHYLGGITDWAAAGLPVEGHMAHELTIGPLARRDVPTCSIDERVDIVLARMKEARLATCFIVNGDRIVLGRLYRSELRERTGTVGDAMHPGPSTYRPDMLAREMLDRMIEHNLISAPVTTSDGRLLGLVLRRDLERAFGRLESGATAEA